ncbi:hypothetical protein ACLB2K_007036 [Fragaria x ananassa]
MKEVKQPSRRQKALDAAAHIQQTTPDSSTSTMKALPRRRRLHPSLSVSLYIFLNPPPSSKSNLLLKLPDMRPTT